jgi:hypothetical protein
MNMEDDLDLRRFKTLKMRFDVLAKEMHDVHEEWRKLDKVPSIAR